MNAAEMEKMLAPGSFGALKAELEEMNPVDIANAMSDMDKSKMLILFRLMPKDQAAAVFTYLDPSVHRNNVDAISAATSPGQSARMARLAAKAA